MKLGMAANILLISLAAASPARAGDDGQWADRWMGRDKLSHFAFSLGAVGLSYHLLAAESGFSGSRSRSHAAGVAVSLGLAKEVRDQASPGNTFSLKDLAADLLGTAVGLLIFTINDR